MTHDTILPNHKCLVVPNILSNDNIRACVRMVATLMRLSIQYECEHNETNVIVSNDSSEFILELHIKNILFHFLMVDIYKYIYQNILLLHAFTKL